MEDDVVEFNLLIEKTLFDKLATNAKDRGLDLSEYISLLVKTVYFPSPQDPQELTK
jgi:hypothetical protein